MSDEFTSTDDENEAGARVLRSARSPEVYRIGGLIDVLDARKIAAEALSEFGILDERVADAVLARLAHADILPCRVYPHTDIPPGNRHIVTKVDG